MFTVKFDTKKITKTINNVIEYSDGFISETKASKQKIANKMANTSINTFYEYLDGLARVHPGMLHHVYEWGEIGNPSARLFELSAKISQGTAVVGAEFLESTSVSEKASEPFYNKAEIMEAGEAIVVTEQEAQALFFEVDGEEVFRKGPIVIPNPGGEGVRGSFVEAFNEFYTSYFSQVYLRSIKFYEALQNPRAYSKNIRAAVRGSNARTIGKNSAVEWISNIPGDDFIDS